MNACMPRLIANELLSTKQTPQPVVPGLVRVGNCQQSRLIPVRKTGRAAWGSVTSVSPKDRPIGPSRVSAAWDQGDSGVKVPYKKALAAESCGTLVPANWAHAARPSRPKPPLREELALPHDASHNVTTRNIINRFPSSFACNKS